MPGATKGGAIRLFDACGHTLGVAEGIESALSLHLIRKIPVWASFCADNLERVRLPEGLRKLEIAVDLDESGKGEAVAAALAKRVHRCTPDAANPRLVRNSGEGHPPEQRTAAAGPT
jgi:putative DNA primase/helicase